MIRSDTIRKGESAVYRSILRAIELGCTVSRPCIEGSRYDLVIDRGSGRMERVQIKYCERRRGGAYELTLTRHCGGRARRIYPYDASEVDAVVAYLAQDDLLVWLPVSEWNGRSAINLRIDAPGNGQRRSIRMAADFRW
jgi:hypothetical protein